MRIRSRLVAAWAALALAAVVQSPAMAETPPATGCPIMITPTSVTTCDGTIVWGGQHGTARVHAVVSVAPPRVAEGMTVTYAWKIGATYSSGHHDRRLGWAALGTKVSVKVEVRTRHGGVSRYYYFGVVRPPA